MNKTRYTVKVDDQSIDLDAYGTYSAAAHAMKAFCVEVASRVTVIAGSGERVSYIDVHVDDMSINCISYKYKD